MMRRLRNFILSAAGGTVLAPLFACGHGCEFLMARLDVESGRVRLETTADVAGNPLIQDESAAEEAVRTSLQLRTPAGLVPLSGLGSMTLERRSEWDAGAPALSAPATPGQPHQLTTAVWEWRPDLPDLVFAVPRGSLHDVLLWTRAGASTGKQAQWTLLVEGESSPVIQIPRTASGKMLAWLSSGLVLAGVLLLHHNRSRFRRIRAFSLE